MSKPKVFISHSGTSSDRKWLDQFARALERQDLSVLINEVEFDPGESFVQEIRKALRSSDIIVSLIDDEAANSPNIFFELGAAVALGKRMVAIVPSNFNLRLLPDPLRERSFLLKGTPDETAKSLASLTKEVEVERGELSDAELDRVAEHITNYLNANNFTKVSFERIRERINPNYSDELLLKVIDRLPRRFRRVRLKGNRPGIGLVRA
jgi:hypothetical protein